MNTILQKRIEEAAENIVEDYNHYQFLNDGTKDVYTQSAVLFMLNEMVQFILNNQWISVEEALPEFQQSVVVTNSEGDYWTSWRLNDNCEDTDDNGFVNNGIGEITHWMSIPPLEGGEE